MNNSHLALNSLGLFDEEAHAGNKEKLGAEEARLVRIIEALVQVRSSQAWSTLKNEVFDGLAERLAKVQQIEARQEDVSPQKLNRLEGERKWAERYAHLDTLEQEFRLQLKNIRLQLHGKSDQPGRTL